MFSLFKLLLLLLFLSVLNSRPNNYSNENLNFSNESNQTPTIDLSADTSNTAVEEGNDVRLLGYGYGSVNLTLLGRSLDVKIDLRRCEGRVKFCYSSLDKFDDPANPATLCDNGFCAFYFDGRRIDEFDLAGSTSALKSNLKTCVPIHMQHTITLYCGFYAESCEPLIDVDNKITIIIDEISCPTLIKNAKIYVSPTSTTSLPTTESNGSKTSNASFEWYFWLIIIIALVLLIGGIGIIFFCCWKKQICLFKKKEEIKKKITITDTVNSTIITKAEDIPDPKDDILEAKLEQKSKAVAAEEAPPPPKLTKKSKKKSKKQKKQTKKNTVENAPRPLETTPAPVVKPFGEPDVVVAPPQSMNSFVPPSNHLTQEQVLDEDYYYRKEFGERAKRMKSKSSKSGSNRKPYVYHHIHVTNEMLLEPHYSSLRRYNNNGLPQNKKWEEFEQHYKVDPSRKPLDIEVSLLSDSFGDIFSTINRLTVESQTVLKERGAEFRKNGRAKKFSTSVYEYLEDSETPEYSKYVAMGAEIGKNMFLDETHFKHYSISALLLIGFTTSLPDKTRRHALAILRRKIPKIRRETSVEEREKYGYPSNAIELAYQRDSQCFENVEAIKTDSTENVSEVTQE